MGCPELSALGSLQSSLSLLEVKGCKRTVKYKKGIDLNKNGKLESKEIIDIDGSGKNSKKETWNFFFRNIESLPPKDVKVVLEKAIQSDDQDVALRAAQALKTVQIREMKVKIAQYSPVKLITNDSALNPRQKKIKALLVNAAKIIDNIFWLQNSYDGIKHRDQLRASTDPLDKAKLEYLEINYGRFDVLDERTAFVGKGKGPIGAAFYPPDMTKAEFEKYLKDHPKQEKELTAMNTLVRRDGEGGLITIPFETEYKPQLQAASSYLRQAAKLTRDPALKGYLVQKAEDLLSGKYAKGDIAWLKLAKSAFDIIIGPMEVYDDGIREAKASYESLVLQRDPEASKAFGSYKASLTKFQTLLPVKPALKDKKVVPRPIGVFDLVYAGGDANQGMKAFAVNLPNDAEVRNKHGNRFILFNNVMKAKASLVLKPIAKRIIDPSQVQLVGEHEFASFGVQHELAHSLGMDFVVDRATGKKTKVKVKSVLKALQSGLEEGKADVLALYNLRHMKLTPEQEMRYYVTTLASIFRSARFGFNSHAKGSLIRLHYLIDGGAVSYDKANGTWKVIGIPKMREALKKLTIDLLEIQGYGDYARAEKLVKEKVVFTPDMKATIAKLKGIPIDVRFVQ